MHQNHTSRASHTGVMLSTQLRSTADDGAGKKTLFLQAIEALPRAREVYTAAFTRWQAQTSTPSFQSADFSVAQRMVVGMGSESVLETGITLHYTYGTPIIPGSALKGLTAHFCDNVLGEANREFLLLGEFPTAEGNTVVRAGHYYQMLFGTNESSGIITFHDAWMHPESIGAPGEGLLPDVLTSHHKNYYAGANDAAPHDAEDPIPISFLSVRGKFRVVLEVQDNTEDARNWREFTLKILRQALQSWGVGAKTSSGYGRLLPLPVPQ